MSPAQQRHIRRVHRVFTLLFVMCLGLISPAAAQPAPEWQLFDLPEAADLILGDVPGSEQAVSLLPAEGISTLLLASTPLEQVSLAALDPAAWRQTASVELWPGDSLALQTADGQRYALALLDSGTDDPTLVALRYTVLDEPPSSTPVIQEAILAYYDALDLDTGDSLRDETIASVVLCDSSPVEPTPPPTTVPEPGSAGLLILGVLGVWLSWRLARRKGRAVWLPLLLLSLVFGVQGIDTSDLVAQLRDCLLTIERDGNGSGRVTSSDGAIECGESCALHSGSGEVYHVKAIAEDGSRFVEWLMDGDPYRGLFHMSGDTVLTAVFEETQPPVAVNDRYSTEEDVALEIPAPGILENDSDPDGDALSGELVKLPLHGTVILDADGSFVYTPNLDFSGIDQFLYRVSDGELTSAIAAVTIEVLAVSDAPAADDRHAETVMNTPVDITLQGHDPDGDELRYRIVDLPANGALSAADNQVTYTPNTDFLGQDSFTYLVNDGTSDSNLATVTITVKNIDLAIGELDLSQTDFDPETMTLSGAASVSINNAGAEAIDGGYKLQLLVKDLQQETTIELGRITISEPLAPGDSLTVDVPVNGVTPFKDAPVYAFVDSENVIAESDEENNLTHTLVDCQMEPAEPGSFEPVLEWEWTGSNIMPEYNQVIAAPVVASLNDDNTDGIIDKSDTPDIVFPTFSEDCGIAQGARMCEAILRAIRGDGSKELFSITDSSYRVSSTSNPAIGDIDQDGFVEIVTLHADRQRLIAFNHDGTLKWLSDTLPLEPDHYGAAPAIANIDQIDGPEIILGNVIINSDGTLRGKGSAGNGSQHLLGWGFFGPISLVADIDLDHVPEILAGNTVYSSTMGKVWEIPAVDGFNAVANFDTDPYPEIVLVSDGEIYLLEHTGEPIWENPVRLPDTNSKRFGGPPTIADFNQDGKLEIGIAGANFYHVLNSDGTFLWQKEIQDVSSAVTGSTEFDFEGDGGVEIIYADEKYLRIYRGADGEVLFEDRVGSGTLVELPVVVDVDNDHNAEIVVGSNNHRDQSNRNGIQVYGDANDSWVNTRKIWNQHSYHITNVNDDGTIPQFEANSWEEHNTYRCNLSDDALACEDYSASYVRVDATDFPASAIITARIGNSGIVDAAVPLNVAFYEGDPQNGGTLLGATTTQNAPASGDYEDVSLSWTAPAYGLHELYVVVDDDGTGQGQIRESDETNNTASTVFDKPNYDLAALQVDPTNSVFEPQTMGISGSVAVSVENLGSSTIDSSYTVQVYIEDSADGSQQILGSMAVTEALASGDSQTVEVPVDGTLLFKDQLIYAFVDSEDVLDETDEENNVAHNLVDCQIEPADPGSFEPVLEWEWGRWGGGITMNGVYQTPVVANLTDDNGDGAIDQHDIPSIIFITVEGANRTLRALKGDGSGEVFTVHGYELLNVQSPAVGDIDLDGMVEIVVTQYRSNNIRLLAFEHDGTFKWEGDKMSVNYNYSNLNLADLDQDGRSEIIAGRMVFDHRGTLQWVGALGGDGDSVVANLDLNGPPEIIAGNTVYSADGEILWHNPQVPDGFLGVANFDGDPAPEIVVVGEGEIFLVDQDGTILWQRTIPGRGRRGGTPVIADLDGDGRPEIGVAGQETYQVFEPDGALKWSSNISGARIVSASIFDFEGDGSPEVVCADGEKLRIYRGTDGEVLFETLLESWASKQYPVVADVDGDQHAEIVVGGNKNFSTATIRFSGIKVFGDASDAWMNTRRIWNQYNYHVTNVNDDGTIPQVEANSWEVHNTYRCNPNLDALACEDYSASALRVNTMEFPASVTLIARVGNAGMMTPAFPLHVAFYEGDPQNGGVLLGATSTQETLSSGAYEDVSLTWDAPSYGLHEIYVVVDDDGSGNGSFRESDEENNIASSTLFIGETPVADAGDDRSVSLGELVTLDGSHSTDPAGYIPLTYEWQLVSLPDGSAAVLDDTASVTPSFTADLIGTYLVQLVVENTQGIQSAANSVVIFVPESTPPSVSIVSPTDATEDPVDGSLTIQAEASDVDGEITKVEFYARNTMFGGDTILFGETETAPYRVPWTIVEPGIHAVTARAYDDSGAWSDSDPIHIIVQNGQPEIVSEPSYSAPIGELYSYDVEAIDPNEDPLTYSLEYGPDGMTIDSATGLIRWTPTESQIGQQQYRVIVEDGRGAGAGQTVDCFVPDVGNTPPQIVSDPVFTARVGEEYVYDVEATDADNDPLSFRFMKAPDGMGVNAESGRITWTPAEDQIGTQSVTVVADDGRNGIGGQFYTLTVRAANVPPTVSISAPVAGREVEEGSTLTIRAEATDSDDGIEHVDFFIDETLVGRGYVPAELGWTAAGLGEHMLYAVATDNAGASTESDAVSFTVIEPLPDTEAPIVTVTVSPEFAQLGETITIQIEIADTSAIDAISLDINGESVPVENGQASYTTQETGFFTVTASATDAAGNSGSGSAVFSVSDGTDTTAPQVDLHDDVEFECVEIAADLYDISGSVTDDGEAHYQLQSREKGTQTWETLAEGTTSSLNGVLATFDPTTHRNGIHEIRLSAEDTAGHSAEVTGCLLVDGRFKVGQSSIGGIDFNIPQLGYPLLAGRVYDSRNLDGGSFGPGWSLPHEGSNVQAEYTYEPSEGWGEDVQGGMFSTYILVSYSRKVLVLRLGEGVFKFKMEVTPKTSFMRPIMDNATPLAISYVPMDGTEGTLETPGAGSQVLLFSDNDGTLAYADDDNFGEPYNPTRFKLTLEDGSVYLFDKDKGLLSMTDPYGHAIEYSDDGISHSSGASLSFERDTESRIEQVVDQLGRTIEYQYDDDGMLEQVIQKGGGSYAVKVLENYAYSKGVNEVPILKDIIAPDGTYLGTFEYDSQGRKTGLIDHEGNRVLFGYDAPEHHYTVTDRRGNPTDYTYDSDGNVTGITDAEGNSESYSYDEDGNVLSKTNKLGYTTAYSYDEDGNVLTETGPLGNSMTYTYDADGNRLTETNPLGHTVTFGYDAYGNLTSVENALGHVTSFSYNADGLKASTTDALGQTSTYGYDPQGNLTAITDPLGYSVTSTYDAYGNALTVTDKEGLTISNDYDGQGRLIRTTDQAGKVHEYTHNSSFKIEEYITPLGDRINNSFDPNGNLTVSRDPSGHEVHFDYDPNGNQTTLMTTITTENGPETFTIEKVYDALNRMTEEIDGDGRSLKAEYDALGRPTARIDKQGNRTELQYDPRGMLTGQTLPDGRTISSSYDAAGRMTAATDARGAATQYDYNAANKLLTATYHNGTAIDHEYDALGRLVSMSSSQGQSFQMTYDPLGRIQSQTDALGRVSLYDYSPGGRLTKNTDPRGNVTEYEYNDAGAVTKMTLPSGSSISYTYDDFGRKASETDPYGRTTFFEWTAAGQLKTITDPAGHATEYSYNDIGYLIAQTDANGHITRYEYDKLGRMVKKTLPLGMFQTYSYGERSVAVTDYNGETTEYEIDQQGRIAQVRFSDGASIASTYTASGELAAVTDRRGTTTFRYDDRGRLLRRTDPDGRAISYSYDSFGRLMSVSVPSGTTSYAYDELGRLSCVTDPDGRETGYTYNQDGNVESVSYPNDTEMLYGYDSQNRVTSVEHRGSSGERLARYTSTFGTKGERLSVEEDSGRRVEFRYDRLGQLIEEMIVEADGETRTIGYSYDPAGNRLEKDDDGVLTTYTYDENDRLLTENDYSYTYDENGNMLTKSGNGEHWQFVYNVQNHLVRVERELSQGSSIIAYQYDYEGIRVSKTINGTQTTTYLVDKNRPYAQVLEAEHEQGALSATVNYVYGHSLISQSIDGVTSYYHHDGSHSVRALSDVNGTLSDTYAYDAYGNLLRQSGDTQNPYRYRSEAFDPELDAYYLRARYYQPGSGRFSSIDPVEGDINVPRSLHRYLYAYNDPVNRLDPSGGMTLTESLITAQIVGIAASGVGYYGGGIEKLQGIYLSLAEKLPDAGVLGVSGVLSPATVPYLDRTFTKWLMKGLNVTMPVMPLPDTFGVVGGLEGLWSFGSSQFGAFGYLGLQGELRQSSWKLEDFTFNLYTGYVWNLWNCGDYTGAFGAFNLSSLSAFFDPEDIGNNTGPWGFSWSLGTIPPTRGKASLSVGVSATYYRYMFFDPIVLSYGELAATWVVTQSLAVAYSAYQGNWVSAFATTFFEAGTGLTARSKEIYNRSWKREKTGETLHAWRSGKDSARPKGVIGWYRNGQLIKRDYWRSGPRLWAGYFTP